MGGTTCYPANATILLCSRSLKTHYTAGMAHYPVLQHKVLSSLVKPAFLWEQGLALTACARASITTKAWYLDTYVHVYLL